MKQKDKGTKLRKKDKGTLDNAKSQAVDYISICPAFSKQDMSDGQCKKCSKTEKSKLMFEACTNASAAVVAKKAVKKAVKKSKSIMTVFGRLDTNKLKYVDLLYQSKNGTTMKQVKNIMSPVNAGSRQPTFYCFTKVLVDKGLATVSNKIIKLSDKGRKEYEAIQKKAA